VGDTVTAREVAQLTATNISQELDFIFSLPPSQMLLLQDELPLDMHILRQLEAITGNYDSPEIHKPYLDLYTKYASSFQQPR
jgi:hypothetical protein